MSITRQFDRFVRAYQAWTGDQPAPALVARLAPAIAAGLPPRALFDHLDAPAGASGPLSAGSDAEAVTAAYRRLFGRDPDPGGLAHWTAALASGALDRLGLLLTLAETAEFAERTGTTAPPAAAASAPPPSQLQPPDGVQCFGDVPVLFAALAIGPDLPVAAADVDRVLASVGLPEAARPAVTAALAGDIRFGDAAIAVEAAQFLYRVGGASASTAPSAPPPPSGGSVRWLRHHLPGTVAAGGRLRGNVRLAPGPGQRLGPADLAAEWLGGPPLRRVGALPLPAPDYGLSVPIDVPAPEQPGDWRLRLTVAGAAPDWILPVAVTTSPPADPAADWTILDDPRRSYADDHLAAFAMLADWCGELGALRVLEVGGNAQPLVADLPGAHINVDVDLRGLRIGAAIQQHRPRPGTNVAFWCADATALTLADGAMDAAVIVAALHHFAEPEQLLAGLARVVRRGGFIAVLCEPVGHWTPEAIPPDFLRELEKGVNEQSFLPQEYARMFAAAGLRPDIALVEGGSLKTRLRHG